MAISSIACNLNMLPQKGPDLEAWDLGTSVPRATQPSETIEACRKPAVLPGLARPTRSPSAPRSRTIRRQRGEGRKQVAWGHFHAVLEPVQAAPGRAASRAGRSGNRPLNGHQPARESFAAGLQHVDERARPARARTRPIASAVAPVRTRAAAQCLAEIVRERADVEARP